MTTVWEAAKALQAIAGGGAPALAAAHDFAAICTRHSVRGEANFWVAVADAIAWNNQIAREIGLGPKKTLGQQIALAATSTFESSGASFTSPAIST
jgi:hypothetical protein